MILFDKLELIAIIEGKQYKIVIDGLYNNSASCEKCALYKLPVCEKYACSSSQHDLNFHYEEIPK